MSLFNSKFLETQTFTLSKVNQNCRLKLGRTTFEYWETGNSVSYSKQFFTSSLSLTFMVG